MEATVMSIKKYTALVTTVRKGSVTAAAAELGVSQSGLTQLLNSLEDDFGITLLVRSRSGIKLTEAGEQLLPLMEATLDADSKVKAAVAELTSVPDATPEKVIRIGSFTSVAVNWLPDIIREFSKAEPDVRIELIDGGYNNIEKTFAEHPIDFGFVRLPLAFDCKTLPLCNDRLLAALPSDFDSNKLNLKLTSSGVKYSVCPTSLFGTEPVVSLIDTVDRDARTVFKSAGVTPNIRYRVEDDYAMLAMVEKGLGIAVVPELMLKDNKRNVNIVELDPPAYRMIGIAFPDYDHISDEAMKFVEFTKKYLG